MSSAAAVWRPTGPRGACEDTAGPGGVRVHVHVRGRGAGVVHVCACV